MGLNVAKEQKILLNEKNKKWPSFLPDHSIFSTYFKTSILDKVLFSFDSCLTITFVDTEWLVTEKITELKLHIDRFCIKMSIFKRSFEGDNRLYTLLHIKIFKTLPVYLLNYLELFVNIWSTITFFALFSHTLQDQYFFEVAIEFRQSILRNIFRLRSFIHIKKI